MADSDATAPHRSLGDEEEYLIPGGKGSQKYGADWWTKWGTIGTWAAIIVTVIGAGSLFVWNLSKADATLLGVQGEVRDVKQKVEKLSEESTKQGNQLQRIEKSVSNVEATVETLRKPRDATPLERAPLGQK